MVVLEQGYHRSGWADSRWGSGSEVGGRDRRLETGIKPALFCRVDMQGTTFGEIRRCG